MNAKPGFWFAAKRYGWGWGLPVCWQGWLVLVSYVALLYAGTHYLFRPRENAGGFFAYVIVLTAVLVTIVVAKGERREPS